MRRLIEHSHLFLAEPIARNLWQNHYPKFEQMLSSIKMTSILDIKKLKGLCLAMTLSKGRAFEALPIFVKDLPKDKLDDIRTSLELHLGKIHPNFLIARWIRENYDILDTNMIPVIRYANESMDPQAFGMMTMARLCELPECIEDLSVLAGNLELSNQSDILNVSLCNFPSQKKVIFDELGGIIDFITLT